MQSEAVFNEISDQDYYFEEKGFFCKKFYKLSVSKIQAEASLQFFTLSYIAVSFFVSC